MSSTLRMASPACITSNALFTSSNEKRCVMNSSTIISPFKYCGRTTKPTQRANARGVNCQPHRCNSGSVQRASTHPADVFWEHGATLDAAECGATPHTARNQLEGTGGDLLPSRGNACPADTRCGGVRRAHKYSANHPSEGGQVSFTTVTHR